MDIDIGQLPPDIAASITQRSEPVRFMHNGNPVAIVVPAERPVYRSHRELRELIGPLEQSFADALREERDAG